jgi:hypothetical protein
MLLRKDRPLLVPIILVLCVVLAGLLIYHFANFREERAVRLFLEDLKAQNYSHAYQLWGPSSNYTYKDFMADWGGKQSYYGIVREYRILGSERRGSGVIVTAEFNHLKNPVNLWVEGKSRQLSFSPF